MRLTANMRAALEQIRRQPARRVHNPGPGSPPWPHPHQTLAALLRHELVDHEVGRNRDGHIYEQWQINDAGRETLDPPPIRYVEGRPNFLRRGRGTTHQPHKSIDYDEQTGMYLESVDAPPRAIREGKVRHAAARDRTDAARRLARNARRTA